jgi:cytochrome c oxidase subunit 4
MADDRHGVAESTVAHWDGHGTGHVTPVRVLAAVWGALVVLTILTVAATWVDLGKASLLVALGIATVKASLVVLYFMHMRYDRPFNAIVFISALVFVAIFVGIALIDTVAYQPEMIPGYAPGMHQ